MLSKKKMWSRFVILVTLSQNWPNLEFKQSVPNKQALILETSWSFTLKNENIQQNIIKKTVARSARKYTAISIKIFGSNIGNIISYICHNKLNTHFLKEI
jgi:hypothetical protein